MFDRNSDIAREDVERAIGSREQFRAFLDRAAAVSQPEDGGPKVLLACAALANVAWVNAPVRIELAGDETTTHLALLSDGPHRERIFPVVTLNVPFDEFVRAARLAPHLYAPLVVRSSAEGRLVLTDRERAAVPSTQMSAVRDDVHSKPTVVRMTAVRPEALPDSGRGDNKPSE